MTKYLLEQHTGNHKISRKQPLYTEAMGRGGIFFCHPSNKITILYAYWSRMNILNRIENYFAGMVPILVFVHTSFGSSYLATNAAFRMVRHDMCASDIRANQMEPKLAKIGSYAGKGKTNSRRKLNRRERDDGERSERRIRTIRKLTRSTWFRVTTCDNKNEINANRKIE